jgi:hypothetical protein
MKPYYFLLALCVFLNACNGSNNNPTGGIVLQLPQDGVFIDLTTGGTVTFRWDEAGAPLNQPYSLWIDRNNDFSLSSAKKFDVDAKLYSFPVREFDNLLKDFGVAESETEIIFWTVVRPDETPASAVEVRSLNVQRIMLAGYAPVVVYEYPGRTFYVDSEGGDDNNSGASEASAWKTLDKVNSYAFTGGDVIRFKRGGLWRGQLIARSGTASNRIVYTSYGAGLKPILQVSIARDHAADWQESSAGVWETDTGTDLDIGNIIFNHGEGCGVKRSSRARIADEGDFFSDRHNRKFYMKYSQNPATRHQSIELVPDEDGINIFSKSNVTIDGLTVRYSGSVGIHSCCDNANVTIRRCDVYWIGGSYQFDPPNPVRYGNAIQFWIGSNNMLVENCRMWECYDAGLTHQGLGYANAQRNITYRNNLMWNCDFSFEYWNRPNTSSSYNIFFENNTCIDAGTGWAYTQRPDRNGTHLNFYEHDAKNSDNFFRNNIFVNAKDWILRMDHDWLSDIALDYNLYYQPEGLPTARILHKIYVSFEDMQQVTGLDANSVFMLPEFISPETRDYRLLNEIKMSNGVMPGILQWDPEWNNEIIIERKSF